jgi:hypothetical protein
MPPGVTQQACSTLDCAVAIQTLTSTVEHMMRTSLLLAPLRSRTAMHTPKPQHSPWRRSRRRGKSCWCRTPPGCGPPRRWRPGTRCARLKLQQGARGYNPEATSLSSVGTARKGTSEWTRLQFQRSSGDTSTSGKQSMPQKRAQSTLTGGADVVQRGGLGGVAVGAGEVDGGDQRDLAAASQELHSTG